MSAFRSCFALLCPSERGVLAACGRSLKSGLRRHFATISAALAWSGAAIVGVGERCRAGWGARLCEGG
jgi:hypothetical protein